ncbi:MAG TPA: hypothetical protein VM536_13315 [Chloroflexia bacterium]|nr:hypothetical protein [Chloroflexia bacterium]
MLKIPNTMLLLVLAGAALVLAGCGGQPDQPAAPSTAVTLPVATVAPTAPPATAESPAVAQANSPTSVAATAAPAAGSPSAEEGPRPVIKATVVPGEVPPTAIGPVVSTSVPGTGPILSPPLREITPEVAVPVRVTPDASGMARITSLDMDQTVILQVGNTLQIALEGGYEATITEPDPSILGVMTAGPAAGTGVYKALKAGQTSMMIQADPPCRKATPPCEAPTRIIRVAITVQ